VTGAAAWLAMVLALYGVFAWILDMPHIAHYFLLLLAIMAVPLARLSTVLLALASNRHRGTVLSDCPSTVPFLGENRAEMVRSKSQLSAVQLRIG
jgi:hypothetical protein